MGLYLFWNCCGGLASKLDTVKLILAKFNPIAFSISEAEISDKSNLKWFNQDGYDLITSKTIIHGKTRLICYIKNDIKYKLKQNLIKSDKTEVIAVDIGGTRMVSVYRPFKTIENNQREALINLTNTITQLDDPNLNMLVGGDFNINLNTGSSENNILQEVITDLSYKQLVKKNTWQRIVTINGVKTLKTSRIDHLYTNCKLPVSITLDDFWTSDHRLVMATVTDSRVQKVCRQKHTTRCWKDYNHASASFVAKKKIERIYNTDLNSEELNNIITESLQKTQEELCPIRIARSSRPSDIISDGIERHKKKRKRTLHKIHKLEKEGKLTNEIREILYSLVEELNRKIKNKIRTERQRIINTKMTSPDPKAFWRQIKLLQGDGTKEKPPDFFQTADNQKITENEDISKAFLEFFQGKVIDLSNQETPYSWVRSEEILSFSEEDVSNALESFKSKMSSGSDGIMMKVVKDTTPDILVYITELMNKVAKEGMPNPWKLSLIRPLHKKGNRNEISNYRPISNLQSLSKLYEKLILNKIEEQLPNEEGNHQHGFRKNRSTTTALLELQDNISKGLDSGSLAAGYSIDMSAAFDLLRPHVFHGLEFIPPPMMNTLMDFLTDRKIFVEYKGSRSEIQGINVGCVQGSVLGPKLFALYTKHLTSKLPDYCHITAYADDTYVSVVDKDLPNLKSKIEISLRKHEEYLAEIGMVVNKEKTELIVFNRGNPIEMELSNGIKSANEMKALGVTITHNLSWEKHVNNTIMKTSKIIGGIRFLRRWIPLDAALKVVTSQYYGTCYYAGPVWLNDNLTYLSWKKLSSQHYRAIRAAVKDHKRRLPKALLDVISKRAPPKQWSKYINSSTAIKLINNSNTRIADDLRSKLYINDRKPKKGTFTNRSRLKIGRHSLSNRLSFIKDLQFDWIGDFSDDYIRANLKRTFFTY